MCFAYKKQPFFNTWLNPLIQQDCHLFSFATTGPTNKNLAKHVSSFLSTILYALFLMSKKRSYVKHLVIQVVSSNGMGNALQRNEEILMAGSYMNVHLIIRWLEW